MSRSSDPGNPLPPDSELEDKWLELHNTQLQYVRITTHECHNFFGGILK